MALDHELFMRSRAFRQLMAQRFSRFLELAVGHRAENPLPGPQDAAIQLRELALESIEIWAERFGMLYRQAGSHHLPEYSDESLLSHGSCSQFDMSWRLPLGMKLHVACILAHMEHVLLPD